MFNLNEKYFPISERCGRNHQNNFLFTSPKETFSPWELTQNRARFVEIFVVQEIKFDNFKSPKGHHLRVQSCSLLYKKILRLNSMGISKVSIGKLINLMSNDASRYELFMIMCAQARNHFILP